MKAHWCGNSLRNAGALGVTDLFGYPGGAILPVYDALGKSKLHHVLVRHEQGGNAYGRWVRSRERRRGRCDGNFRSGRNEYGYGIATAMLDSSRWFALRGRLAASLLGSDAFQEIDITGITMPITKQQRCCVLARRISRKTVREAFQISKSGRPGPVLVDINEGRAAGFRGI